MIPMIKVSLIVLAGLAVARLLRSQSAALRHWVLWTALACAATAPAVQLIVPGWSVWPAERFDRRANPAAAGDGHASQQTFHQPAAAPQGQPPPPSASSSPSSAVSWLWPIWMTGAAISFGPVAGRVRPAGVAGLAVRAHPAWPWRDLADDVARQYGLRTPVVLLQSDHPTLLVTWGMLRPKIILPAAAREWAEDRMRVVLCHELAHIRRGDWAAQMTAELLRSIYWFNPLMWIASTRLRRESEQACDDEVLNLGIDGPDYAGHLLDLARAVRKHRQKPDSRRSRAGHAAPVQPRKESQCHVEHAPQSSPGHTAGADRHPVGLADPDRPRSPASERQPRALSPCPDPSSIR